MTPNMQGKSHAIPLTLFQEWLAKNFNPMPSAETTLLMWHSWLECYLVMKSIRQLGKPHIPNCIIEDEL